MKFTILTIILCFVASLVVSGETFPSEQREFLIQLGIMKPATPTKHRLWETQKITMEPLRKPGFCFLVDPPNVDSYDVYSIHYLPAAPKTLTGEFRESELARAEKGIKTEEKHVEGIQPFCFDFHPGDPLGRYRIEVFINSALEETLHFEVIPPQAK